MYLLIYIWMHFPKAYAKSLCLNCDVDNSVIAIDMCCANIRIDVGC